ncbi:unnamed protein product [Mycena citricolor]|uniref:Xylanolytic transcriptional activator regulatory domain-containing protein n=1 Tax=Mycena citricolor TaxID=2018698 RepID=A0AAD2H961_9AGAR|nr:unnamed protein product [Mycena citricolor]
MPSDGESSNDLDNTARPTPSRSCDLCRKRKGVSSFQDVAETHLFKCAVRCDGPNKEGGHCTLCTNLKLTCTYLDPVKKRGPNMEELRQEIRTLKAKLRSLSLCPVCSRLINDWDIGPPPPATPVPKRRRSRESPLGEETESRVEDPLGCISEEPSVDGQRVEKMYFGPVSSMALAHLAVVKKGKHHGRPQFQTRSFWDVQPWERHSYTQFPAYKFPDPDLIFKLVSLYFARIQPTFQLLHQPSFEELLAEGRQYRDPQFGALLLAVLAVASRLSDDVRVLCNGYSLLSSGWPFFSQIRSPPMIPGPSVHTVQSYALMALYSLGISMPELSWFYIGLATRFLQHRGEHQRKRKMDQLNESDEQWNRAFWTTFNLDRVVNSVFGLPTGLHLNECDADLPLEMDDQYWSKGFTQPAAVPSRLTFFALQVRLSIDDEILGDANRLYTKAKATQTSEIRNVQAVIEQLDFAMQSWLGSVPEDLQWNSTHPDPDSEFFDQACCLRMAFLYVQLVIHRPYIHREEVSGSPSLSICMSTARDLIEAADVWITTRQQAPGMSGIFTHHVFFAAIMLIVTHIGDQPDEMARDRPYIDKTLGILEFGSARWQSSGRFWDMISEFKHYFQEPTPEAEISTTSTQDVDTQTFLSSPASRDAHLEPGAFVDSQTLEQMVASDPVGYTLPFYDTWSDHEMDEYQHRSGLAQWEQNLNSTRDHWDQIWLAYEPINTSAFY